MPCRLKKSLYWRKYEHISLTVYIILSNYDTVKSPDTHLGWIILISSQTQLHFAKLDAIFVGKMKENVKRDIICLTLKKILGR